MVYNFISLIFFSLFLENRPCFLFWLFSYNTIHNKYTNLWRTMVFPCYHKRINIYRWYWYFCITIKYHNIYSLFLKLLKLFFNWTSTLPNKLLSSIFHLCVCQLDIVNMLFLYFEYFYRSFTSIERKKKILDFKFI